MSSEKITRNELRAALLRSGYLLEARVESYLRDAGGYVEANAAYEDPITGKSRELDVYAMAAKNAGPDEFDLLFDILLIECVNNPQPLAFITKEPQASFLHEEDIKISGLPVKIPEAGHRDTWISLVEFLGMENFHHYCKGKIATQFCSFTQKRSGADKEWFANHEEPHFDAIRKLCDAVDFHYGDHFRHWVFGQDERLNIQIYYPLLIVQGELLEVAQTEKGISIVQSQHIQFRRSSIAAGEESSYQIDIIQEAYLPSFIDIVDRELRKTARLLRSRQKVVRKAIDLIVKDASKRKNPAEIKQAMEF